MLFPVLFSVLGGLAAGFVVVGWLVVFVRWAVRRVRAVVRWVRARRSARRCPSVFRLPCPPCRWARVVSACGVSCAWVRSLPPSVGVAPCAVAASGVPLSFWVFGALGAP